MHSPSPSFRRNCICVVKCWNRSGVGSTNIRLYSTLPSSFSWPKSVASSSTNKFVRDSVILPSLSPPRVFSWTVACLAENCIATHCKTPRKGNGICLRKSVSFACVAGMDFGVLFVCCLACVFWNVSFENSSFACAAGMDFGALFVCRLACVFWNVSF